MVYIDLNDSVNQGCLMSVRCVHQECSWSNILYNQDINIRKLKEIVKTYCSLQFLLVKILSLTRAVFTWSVMKRSSVTVKGWTVLPVVERDVELQLLFCLVILSLWGVSGALPVQCCDTWWWTALSSDRCGCAGACSHTDSDSEKVTKIANIRDFIQKVKI